VYAEHDSHRACRRQHHNPADPDGLARYAHQALVHSALPRMEAGVISQPGFPINFGVAREVPVATMARCRYCAG